MRIWFTFILLALIVVAVSFFVSRNATLITIDVGFGTVFAVPGWMALLGAALAGSAATVALMTVPWFSLRLRARRNERRINELEQEVHGLRTLPLSDEDPATTAEG